MTPRVPYVSDQAIEKDAQALLSEYAEERGVVIEPPIPIDDIIEKYLKIRIDFDDMHGLYGLPRSDRAEILGAIFIDQRRIFVDESLDPHENPTKEARYRF